ncbi:ROK family protein [Sphaerisporangium fuscum]|uniref:ROK family protein n=1 Tax=Sphaerisporangium fuscum TaxID=2835868 RepID=UPI0027E26A80|nr:ROK family protein [Sphaerisporangium fuscum]
MAVDVGGTTLKGGLITSGGTILYRERRPTPRTEGPERVIAAISAFVADLTRPRTVAGMSLRPLAVGLAVPGLVKPGLAVFSAAFGWRDVPVDAFADGELPVALGHDVRSAGEAELAYGADADDALYLPIGTGIAGAVVLSGSLYGGTSGWAGQIGHIPVHPGGLPCPCGQRGCLAAYASAAGIAARCGEASAEEVVRRAASGEVVAVRVWDEAVEALALALATYTMVLDPSVIVIGGGLSLAGDALVTPLRERLAARLSFRHSPEVRVSALGTDAGLLGAGLLGWRAVGDQG